MARLDLGNNLCSTGRETCIRMEVNRANIGLEPNKIWNKGKPFKKKQKTLTTRLKHTPAKQAAVVGYMASKILHLTMSKIPMRWWET